jgi:LCP family protein required for cell wall assembly
MTFYSKNEIPDKFKGKLEEQNHKPGKNKFEKPENSKKKKKTWRWIIGILLLIVLGTGGCIAYKTNHSLHKITKGGSIFDLFKGNKLKGWDEDRINVAILGMRGKGQAGGEYLTDSIMILSIKPQSNQAAMISIPRDLYVPIPGSKDYTKINSIYSIGLQDDSDQGGLELSKKSLEYVTGLEIHYAISIDFEAFQEIVDALDGIDITLEKSFSEPTQFEGENNSNFTLPAGENHLDGETALFYTRARYASSDFDRARRQQQVMLAIKDKALSTGTISNPSKVNKLIEALENNIKTDMNMNEIQGFIKLSQSFNADNIIHKVFDTSKEGLLYSEENNGYFLKPVGNDFSQIHKVCQNIFSS